MAEEVLPIKQGDTIYFYDTSVGDIASYSWTFGGGTPSTSTNPNEYVTFNGTNEGGFSVSHSITSTSGITVGVTKNNIISVSPETISSSFTLGSSTRLLSQNATYTSGATASSGIANYSWIIPGIGITSGANLNYVSHIEDNWYDIAGTYAGAINTSYLAASSLSITSNVPNVSLSIQNITYRKMGPIEDYDLANVGLTGPYYTPTISNQNSGNLGIGGSSLVIEIDQSSSWSGTKFDNQYSHSTDEVMYFCPNTLDVSGGSTPVPVRTRVILNKSQLDVAGVTYLGLPNEFTLGSYILPTGLSSIFGYNFYITDYTTTSQNTLTSLKDQRGWDDSSIEEFLKNTYYKSASSKYIETLKTSNLVSRNLFQNGTYGYDWSGGYYVDPGNQPGVIVPSSKFFDDYLGTSGEIEVALSLDVYNPRGTLLDSVRCSISSSGATGNSPDGYLITADDTTYGSQQGIASILQENIDLSDFSRNIKIESSSNFLPFGLDASKNFPGMRVSIVDPYNLTYNEEIGYLVVDWYPPYLEQLSSIHAENLSTPFSGSTIGSNYFSGLPGYIGNFEYTTSRIRGWKLGGEIA